MQIYTNNQLKIGLSRSKKLFKIKNLKNDVEIKINLNDLKRAYNLDKFHHYNKKSILNRVLYLIDKDINVLNDSIKNDKKRLESFKVLKKQSLDIKNEFFPEYHLTSIFRNLLDI